MADDGGDTPMDDRLRAAPGGAVSVDTGGTITAIDDRARTLLSVEAEAIGQPASSVFPHSVEGVIPEALDGATIETAQVEAYYPAVDRWLDVSVVPDSTGATVFVLDVTDRQRREQELERLRAERERTAVVDAVLSDVLSAVVEAGSKDDVLEAICRRLGDREATAFAWVGERAAGGSLSVRSVAGEQGETFPALKSTLEEEGETAERQAIEEDTLQVVHPLAEATSVPENVRVAGFGDGITTVLAVPLSHGGTVHGVVGIYARDDTGVSDRERTSFETLGRVGGFAITAVRNRSLLLSDALTEVTLSVGRATALGALGAATDAALALEGTVPRGDETLLCYFNVEEAPTQRVLEAGQDVDGIHDIASISDGDRIRMTVGEGSILSSVAALGGTIAAATFQGGEGEVVIELPQAGGVRESVDALLAEYDASVTAKRDRQRAVTTERDITTAVEEELTDRQRAVLRAAYLANYFQSPRGSTAEEVASSLDITGSTLLHHLRAAQRTLLEAVFEDDPSSDSP